MKRRDFFKRLSSAIAVAAIAPAVATPDTTVARFNRSQRTVTLADGRVFRCIRATYNIRAGDVVFGELPRLYGFSKNIVGIAWSDINQGHNGWVQIYGPCQVAGRVRG